METAETNLNEIAGFAAAVLIGFRYSSREGHPRADPADHDPTLSGSINRKVSSPQSNKVSRFPPYAGAPAGCTRPTGVRHSMKTIRRQYPCDRGGPASQTPRRS